MRAWPLLLLAIACVRPPPPSPPCPARPPRCSTGVVAGLARTGTIRGLATDDKTGEPLAGVTAIASADGTQAQAAISDERGVFELVVPPGLYLVSVYFADISGAEPCVNVMPGGIATMSVQIDQSLVGGEVIEL